MPITDPYAKPNRANDAQFVGRIRGAQLPDVSLQGIDKLIRLGRLKAFRTKVIVRLDELLRLVEGNEIQ